MKNKDKSHVVEGWGNNGLKKLKANYLLYLLRAMYQTKKPQANTNTTLAAMLEPTTVPRGKASVSTTGGSETFTTNTFTWVSTQIQRKCGRVTEEEDDAYQISQIYSQKFGVMDTERRSRGLPVVTTAQISHCNQENWCIIREKHGKSLTKTDYSTVKSHFLRRKLITHSLVRPLENRHHDSTDTQLYP